MNERADRQSSIAALLEKYGPLIDGKELASLLRFSSMAAFRQALRRGALPVKVFELPGRKGKFAFTQDLVQWLDGVKAR